MISATQANPACPYCKCNKCIIDCVNYFCTTCGAEFTAHESIMFGLMKPEERAERIGRHHALDNWDYLWCVRDFTRDELRAYAQGFLSSAYTSGNTMAIWLYEKQARRDASWRD